MKTVQKQLLFEVIDKNFPRETCKEFPYLLWFRNPDEKALAKNYQLSLSRKHFGGILHA
jgi:hypothetical protein